MRSVPLDIRWLRPYFEAFTSSVTEYQMAEPFSDLRDAAAYFHNCYERELSGFSRVRILTDTDGSRLIGSTEINGLSGDIPSVGIWIAEPFRGRGYAYEAMISLTENAFRSGFNVLLYETDLRNTPAVRLAEKLGGCLSDDPAESIKTLSGKELSIVKYVIKNKN